LHENRELKDNQKSFDADFYTRRLTHLEGILAEFDKKTQEAISQYKPAETGKFDFIGNFLKNTFNPK
jgi:hypothetical protein